MIFLLARQRLHSVLAQRDLQHLTQRINRVVDVRQRAKAHDKNRTLGSGLIGHRGDRGKWAPTLTPAPEGSAHALGLDLDRSFKRTIETGAADCLQEGFEIRARRARQH